MDTNRRKPILIIGGQGVGKTTKARELAGVKPGQEADKFGTFAGFNINFGVGMFHYSQFGDFKIVDEIIAASVLMAVWKKAAHEPESRFIAIVQTGALFPALDEAPGFVRYETVAATLYGERAVVSVRQERPDDFRITLAKTKRGEVKAGSINRKELENLRDNINHVLVTSQV